VPWVVAIAFGPALLWYAATGVLLFVVYTVWSGGFPWYHATDSVIGDWANFATKPGALAWGATVVVLIAMLHRASSGSRHLPARSAARSKTDPRGWFARHAEVAEEARAE
jgi:hypothetical protein